MSYLGLDVGTTGCKAAVFDENGGQMALAYRDYPLLQPQAGWAELDSAYVLSCCLDVIREAVAAASIDPVRGIGISSQGEAFTPVGRDGQILGKAMVSSDDRAAAITTEWSHGFGRERLYDITGHSVSPMFTLFKLLWLKSARPDVWDRAEAFYCFEDLLHYRLGIDPAISWPMAGRTMMFDVRRHQWSDEILGVIGLEPSRLARPLASGTVVGRLDAGAARDLGLTAGTIVVAGGHDQGCGALGAGVVSAGRAVYGIGTVECITPAFDRPVFDSELFRNNLATYDYTIRGMYTTVAYSLTGGNALEWFLNQFEAAEATRTGQSVYNQALNSLPGGPSGLLVLPYLTRSGTPYFDSDVPGTVIGLRLSTTKRDLLKGLLEGVAFEMRLNLDILQRSGIAVNELVATGGGAKNLNWLQLKADALNRPITRASVTEAGCMGAAMLACAAGTGESVKSIAARWVKVSGKLEPDPAKAAIYDALFQTYTKLYPTLKSLLSGCPGDLPGGV